MTPEQEEARRDRVLTVIVGLLVVAAIPAAITVAWALSEALWWLIEHKGWARAAVGAAVATVGALYALHTYRRTP